MASSQWPRVWIAAGSILILGFATVLKEGVVKHIGIFVDEWLFPKKYTLTVHPFNQDNNALRHTLVTLDDNKLFTDEAGKVIFDKLKKGIYYYSVIYNKLPHTYSIYLKSDSDVKIKIFISNVLSESKATTPIEKSYLK